MRSRLNRILIAAVLMPLVLLAASSTASAAWRCQFDGVLRARCCCPKPDPEAQAAAAAVQKPASVQSQSCCDVERQEIDKAPSEPSRQNQGAAVAASVQLPVALLPWHDGVGPEARAVSTTRVERPPAAGRLLLVQKHSLLI